MILSITALGCGDDAAGGDTHGGSEGTTAASSSSSSTGAGTSEGTTAVGSSSTGAGTSEGGSTGVGSTGVDSSGGGSGDTGGATFPCGDALTCSLDTEYCSEIVGGLPGNPPSYGCAPLPPGCGDAPSCACLADEPCGNMCEMGVGGGLQVTCLAP